MFDNYDDLISAFSSWLVENGVQTNPAMLVRLAEDELASDPRLFIKKSATVRLDTDGVVTLPQDLAEILAWTIGTPWSSRLYVASERDSASLEYPGVPKTYHVIDGRAYLRPVPHETMTSDLTYRIIFRNLDYKNTRTDPDDPDPSKNGYIEKWPSLYWYACLEQACDYSVQLVKLAPAFRTKKETMIKRVKSWQERRVMGGSPSRKVNLGGSGWGF